MKNFKLNFILLSVLIVSVVLIVLSSSLHLLTGGKVPFDYGIAIDAGSSKTKFFLYDWSSVKTNGTGFVNELTTQKLAMSIDEYADDLPTLITPLIKTLNQISNKIEYTRKGFEVPIFLGKALSVNSVDRLELIRTDSMSSFNDRNSISSIPSLTKRTCDLRLNRCHGGHASAGDCERSGLGEDHPPYQNRIREVHLAEAIQRQGGRDHQRSQRGPVLLDRHQLFDAVHSSRFRQRDHRNRWHSRHG